MNSDSLYTGMAGLQAITAQMQAVASNIANAQTPGYEAVQAVTDAQLYQGTNAPVGADAALETLGPDLKPGPLKETGDPMNVGIGGNAWLQVQTANGTALTRNGSLSISSAGLLTDSAGNPILNTNGTPISLPALAKLHVAAPFSSRANPGPAGCLNPAKRCLGFSSYLFASDRTGCCRSSASSPMWC